ncbi:hypothetical protein ACWJJH_03640 [Endozoicomonadaceae bacterium StTr2]
MKYKNIRAAIHNFGHSFISFNNFSDSGYLIHALQALHSEGHDIEIDWLAEAFEPGADISPVIRNAIEYWAAGLEQHLASHGVDRERLILLRLKWPAGQTISMEAMDDRSKLYKIEVSQSDSL